MELTREQKLVMEGKLCPYCNQETEFTGSIRIYGVNHGMIYACFPCQAWVGCHKHTDQALGRVAKKGLRMLKNKAHEAFDRIWKEKLLSRKGAYAWLGKELGLPSEYTHIGMFSEATCKKVIELSNKYADYARQQRKKTRNERAKITPGRIQEILLQKQRRQGTGNLQRQKRIGGNDHKNKE